MKNEIKGEIGRRIKIARKYRNRSQQWLADELGLAQVSVSGWERGANNPSTTNMVAISKYLDINYQWLATGADPMELTVYEPVVVHVAAPIHQSEDDLAKQELLTLFDALPRTRRSVLLEFVRGWVGLKEK